MSELSCGHQNTHDLTADNQPCCNELYGSEDKDQRPEVRLLTQREID